jgi:hypothetical protein
VNLQLHNPFPPIAPVISILFSRDIAVRRYNSLGILPWVAPAAYPWLFIFKASGLSLSANLRLQAFCQLPTDFVPIPPNRFTLSLHHPSADLLGGLWLFLTASVAVCRESLPIGRVSCAYYLSLVKYSKK